MLVKMYISFCRIKSRTEMNINVKEKGTVLITGGSGMIGSYLTGILIGEGFQVRHLSRQGGRQGEITTYKWDPSGGYLDEEALKGTDYIIHLAGANIGEGRWTKRRRAGIVESRVASARLLHRAVASSGTRLRAFISASATGYYGAITSDYIFSENDLPADDFLGHVCREWEEAASLFEKSGTRTVIIRTPVVLAGNDSALSKMMLPAKAGFLVKTGSGRQYMPWIHIADLCAVYLRAIKDDNMTGAYNAVAPQHVRHDMFMSELGRVLKKPLLSPAIPGFLLRLVLGEMSSLVLHGSRVTPEKIIAAGYSFKYPDLHSALENVIKG